MEVYFSTLWPPTVNSYYMHTKHSGVFLSKQGRSFRAAVEKDALEQNIYNLMLDYKLSVDIILYPPDSRVRDLDNYMKGLLDGITHAGIWKDDSLIDSLCIYRGITLNRGKVEMRISEHHGFILPADQSVWGYID